MSRTLTDEGRKVLKFLAATGAVIVSGSGQEEAPVRLEGRQDTGGKRRQMIVTVRVLLDLKHLGLTREAPDGALRLSTEGRLHVRRMLSGGGDGFQLQHQVREPVMLQTGDGSPIRVTVNLAESPLAWLARRKDGQGKAMLTAAQVEAGERLREDFTFAAMMPGLSGGWRTEAGGGRNTGRGPAGADMSDNVMAARLRVERALDAAGRGLGGVLVDVCCLLKGLETVERERGWPARSAKVVLGIGLSALASHYGMAEAKKALRKCRGPAVTPQPEPRPRRP
ncbi:Uncharacterised protein [Pannonibacter phragmitetus]|uniref:DUF6456 domain-containing protein n=1 Tax=Pannonibacter phragmitetus TaxID=121719 RepID=A0A378ZSQ3_9HYPH|nr:DUF6456 domain-containing protein [Pannonibacter phragmitetus]SUB00272.1 Uncharacterised protein [Pannonibacter phragmitetus]